MRREQFARADGLELDILPHLQDFLGYTTQWILGLSLMTQESVGYCKWKHALY